ncbi:MAG: RagB/SusD family nutrient uptake outer membrane protein [Alistipes sp.]|nr:RagB/SusD family nutrient uptake outer membrane protein [Alistipes sp.]
MKKLAILLAFFGLTALTSCEMEKYPADKQVMDTALETLADLEKFEAGVYSTFRAAYNVALVPSDMQADYVNPVKEFGENYGALHRWEYGIDDYDIYDIWVYAYYAIANANFVISNKDEITYDKENPEEVAIFNTILGEMYFVRAMSHFLILDKFAGAYNAAKADEAYSGIPIISAFNPTEVPSRATMNQSYASIISDLETAEDLLAGVEGEANSNYITIDAVSAALARVYLQKKDYTNAYNYAKDLINDGTYPLIDTEAGLKALYSSDKGSEVILSFYSSTTELNGVSAARWFVNDPSNKNLGFEPNFIPTQKMLDLFADEDIRKNTYFIVSEDVATTDATGAAVTRPNCKIGGSYIKGVYMFNKYPGNPALQSTPGTKNNVNAIKFFRIAEMYLIAAEAGILDANATTDGAKYLNDLRQKRGLAAIDAPTMADVKEERVREMMFEGQRISDLKRWGDGLEVRTPQAPIDDNVLVTTGDHYELLTVPANDFRWVWPIPAKEVYANQLLNSQQNPGWNS